MANVLSKVPDSVVRKETMKAIVQPGECYYVWSLFLFWQNRRKLHRKD